jgi:ribosomal protein L37AE/L43A
MREHRGIASGSTIAYGPYIGVCTDNDCQCHFFFGAAKRTPCKHLHVGRDSEDAWFCHDCGQPFRPVSREGGTLER